MIKFTFDISALENHIKNMAIDERKKRLISDLAGSVLLRLVLDGFKTSTSPEGAKWQSLKRRKGQILVDKAMLKNSIVTKIRRDSVEIGTDLVYAATHQFGTTIKRKSSLAGLAGVKIPARPYLPVGRLSKKWSDELKDEIIAFLTQ